MPVDIRPTWVHIHPYFTKDSSTEITSSHLITGRRSRRVKWVELEFWIKVHLNLRHRLLQYKMMVHQKCERTLNWALSSQVMPVRTKLQKRKKPKKPSWVGIPLLSIYCKRAWTWINNIALEIHEKKIAPTLVCSDFCGFTHLNCFTFAS